MSKRTAVVSHEDMIKALKSCNSDFPDDLTSIDMQVRASGMYFSWDQSADSAEPAPAVKTEDTKPKEANPKPDSPDLKAAIELLDPKKDSDWTKSGLPSMSAIESLIGVNVSRDEVELAMPNYNRDKAKG